MSYVFYKDGEFDTEMIEIKIEDYYINFSVEAIKEESRAWLAEILLTQMTEIIQKERESVINSFQSQFKSLLGIK